MYRLTFTTDDQGGIVPTIQIRTTCRRPVAVDSQGWELADAPGPHAVHAVRFDRVHYRAQREELQP
ncbi:hypothetical protein [Pseudomonas sp. OF001]|uniref:hypothetical protein n=1 Tax=Pseudomonas sp. OF001 TaxID=2772300 RepID=UPI00191ACFE6|nr:hypothetical protein [Pseudomonas sp. OF001]